LTVIEHYYAGGRITEDWMEEQKEFIMTIRDFFGNMEKMNMECQDKRFRCLADECELILNHLIEEISETMTFTVDMYHRLNLNIQTMIEIKCEDEELCDLMSEL
jgi:hypothetical protein